MGWHVRLGLQGQINRQRRKMYFPVTPCTLKYDFWSTMWHFYCSVIVISQTWYRKHGPADCLVKAFSDLEIIGPLTIVLAAAMRTDGKEMLVWMGWLSCSLFCQQTEAKRQRSPPATFMFHFSSSTPILLKKIPRLLSASLLGQSCCIRDPISQQLPK